VADDYWYLQLDVEEIEVENVETVQNRPINVNLVHDFDSPSLEVGRVAGPRGICRKYAEFGKICHIYATYAAYMPHICAAYFAKFCIFSHKFVLKSPTYFKKILRYKPTSLHSDFKTILHGLWLRKFIRH